MTIDERLDRLTERHEALTQSHELFSHDLRDLAKATSDHTKQIAEQGRHIDGLIRIAEKSAASIDAPGRIAAIHERRLDDLEGTS